MHSIVGSEAPEKSVGEVFPSDCQAWNAVSSAALATGFRYFLDTGTSPFNPRLDLLQGLMLFAIACTIMPTKTHMTREATLSGRGGFSLIEVLSVIMVLGVVVSTSQIAVKKIKSDSQATGQAAVAKILNDAEARSIIEGIHNNWSDKYSAFNAYRDAGIVSGVDGDVIDSLSYIDGHWQPIPLLSHMGEGSYPSLSSGRAGTFDLDGQILWAEYSSAERNGEGRDWIEGATGAELEAIFVFLEEGQERTDFVHNSAGAPGARMFGAAWSQAVGQLIAQAYTDPGLARATHEFIPGEAAGRFYAWLSEEARW